MCDKIKIKATFEVNEDWTPNYCQVCPFNREIESYDEDDGYDYYDTCVLDDQPSAQCPLEGNYEVV